MSEHRRTGTEAALTALRIVVGIIFVAHGVQKLADPQATAQAFASMGIPGPALSVWLAIVGEFVGGLGLLLGALTRIAALGPLVTMIAAIIWVHLGNGLFAQKGGFEYPLVLLLTALVFAVHGGGPFSLDAYVKRSRDSRTPKSSEKPAEPLRRRADQPV